MICDCGQKTSREVPIFPWHCSCGAVWLSTTAMQSIPQPCPYLGEPTGEVITCGGCGGGTRELEVMRCERHGTTLLHKPTIKAGYKMWDGMNCVQCKAEGLDG